MSTDRLRLGTVKVVVDGSIQGFSARLRPPGYYNGAPNGLWYIAPEQLGEIFERALMAGVRVHSHTNGDEATELVLDTLELALRKNPSPDHRFTLQHCQLANSAQFRRMRALGMCVNLFPNHHFYWGDQHYALTVGPERAERMNACATALANGVPMAIHSDAPVTPLGPLFTAWCAVNRLTSSGRRLGTEERISVGDALRTITLGAAFTHRPRQRSRIDRMRQARRLCRPRGRSDRDRRRTSERRPHLGHRSGRPHLRRGHDMTAPIPVTLIGGYLGAGKTTLVNALLRNAGGRRLAVLVNEFGALPIDGDLIEARDENLISISGGCICCSFGSDLVAALIDITSRGQPIDHVLIETSGVALPGSIVQSLALIQGLAVDGVIVLADAETIEQRARDRYMSDTVLAQLAGADIIVLNKIDLVSRESAAATLRWLGGIVPGARVVPVQNACISPDIIMGRNPEPRPDNGQAAVHRHETADYEALSLAVDGPRDADRLAAVLADPRLGLLRAKGFVQGLDGVLVALHVVGRRSLVEPAPTWIEGPGQLVCIGLASEIDRAAIMDAIKD